MTAPAVTAPFLAATLLLGVAGAFKVLRPADTANALRAAGLPSRRGAVRAGALFELGVAGSALVWPGPLTGALVAGSYVVFAGFVATALRHGWAIASCGCFGRDDTQPTWTHVAMNLAAALSATWWAAAAPSSLARALNREPWGGVPLLGAAAVVAYLGYLVFTNPLTAARRRPRRSPERPGPARAPALAPTPTTVAPTVGARGAPR